MPKYTKENSKIHVLLYLEVVKFCLFEQAFKSVFIMFGYKLIRILNVRNQTLNFFQQSNTASEIDGS